MKFDLLDAMAHMRQNFGYSGEILLRQSPEGYITRLSVFDGNKFYNSEYLIPMIEITDCKVNVMNLKFKEALERLKGELKDK